MFKKIAILGILMTLFVAGNLLASQTYHLRVWVWAQDVVEWKLYVDGEEKEHETGNHYCGEQPSWELKDYEVKVLGVVVTSGTFPGMSAIYDIIVPVEWPTNPDPEE